MSVTSIWRPRSALFSAVALVATVMCETAHAQYPLRVVVSDRISSTVRIFNAADVWAPTGNTTPPAVTVPTGSTPQETVASPNGRIGFVANFNSNYISVIDLIRSDFLNGFEIRRIPGLARSVALNSSGTTLVATSPGNPFPADRSGFLNVIDTQTFAVTPVKLPAETNPQQVVVVGTKAYINARGFTNPQHSVVVDLAASPMTATTIPNTNVGFGPPKGGVMTTPDGRVIMLRGVNSTPPVYQLLIIDPTLEGTPNYVKVVTLPWVTYAIAATANRAFLVHRAAGAIPAGIGQVDLDPGSPTYGAVLAANTPFIPLPATTPFATNGMFQMAISPDSQHLILVGADYSYTPKITSWSVLGLIGSAATQAPDKAFSIPPASMIRDVHFVPAIPSALPPMPTPNSVCAPATPTVACPKTVTTDSTNLVTIRGLNFQPGALVRFGNSDPLPATFVSSTQLTVLVPAGHASTQSADVLVTLPGSTVADQHTIGGYRKAINFVSPASFQPLHQVVVGNFGDSTMTVLNSGTNQAVSDPVPAGVQPISVAVAPSSKNAMTLSFGPSMIHRRSLLQYEDSPGVSALGVQSGQINALEITRSTPLFDIPTAFAWSLVDSPTVGGTVPMLSLHSTDGLGISAFQRQRMTTAATGLWSMTVDPQGEHAYAVSVSGGVSRLNIFTIVPGGAFESNVSPPSVTLASLGLAEQQPNLHVSPNGNTLAGLTPTGGIALLDITNRLAPAPSITLTPDDCALPGCPVAVSFSDVQILDVPGSRRVYGWDPGGRVVEVFDPSTPGAALGAVQVPGFNGFSTQMKVTPDGRLAYVALADEDAVAVIDLTKLNRSGSPGAVLAKVRTGLGPVSLAIRPGLPVPLDATFLQVIGNMSALQPGGIGNVTVSFVPGTITSPGTLTATTTNRTKNPLPAGFSLGPVPVYYEISAGDGLAFSQPATLCLPYNAFDWAYPNDPSRIVIRHFNGATWDDLPTTIDFEKQQACAKVTSFSPFTLGVYDRAVLLSDLSSALGTLDGNRGLINALRVKVEHALESFDQGELSEARDALSALRNQIEAQADKKLLSAEEASALIAQIDAILAQL